ncbi:MAG: hypothetical protein DRH70_07795, partial [Candidatus Coatesbacteria bacterium]
MGFFGRDKTGLALTAVLSVVALLTSACNLGGSSQIRNHESQRQGIRDLAFAGDGHSVIYVRRTRTIVVDGNSATACEFGELCFWSGAGVTVHRFQEIAGANRMPCFPFFSNAGFPRYFVLNAVPGDECAQSLQPEASRYALPCVYCLDTQKPLLDTLLCTTDNAGICVYKAGVPPELLPVIIQGTHVPGSLAKVPGAGQFNAPDSPLEGKISSSRLNVAIYSLEDGSLKKLIALPSYSVAVDSCVVPTAGEPIVGVVRGDPSSSRATVDFIQGGKTLVAGTRGLGGVTP